MIGHLAGRTLLYGPLKFKVDSVAKLLLTVYFIKGYAGNYVTISESFSNYAPRRRDSGSFLWKNIGPG